VAFWAVVQTVTKAEQETAERLRTGQLPLGYRFDAFVPLAMERRRNRKGRYESVPTPVYPGYIFVLITGAWWPVVTCQGAVKMILNGDSPAALPTQWVEARMADQERRGFAFSTVNTRFRVGQRVRVEAPGATYGMTGFYQGMSKKDHVRVLFEMLGRAVPTDIPERELAAA
jgi:transcription antitermination factor NusG